MKHIRRQHISADSSEIRFKMTQSEFYPSSSHPKNCNLQNSEIALRMHHKIKSTMRAVLMMMMMPCAHGK